MISSEAIKGLSVKNRTNEVNITREYFQNLFLSYFYQKEKSKNILFKGGTALRLIYHSPRFSEDLDFTGVGIRMKDIEEIVNGTVIDLRREGLTIHLLESKSTSGGYLGILNCNIHEWITRIQIEVSLRLAKKDKKSRTVLIANQFIPSYTIVTLHEEQLISEKIDALLKRGKHRDFFDLYFILRERIAIKSIIPYKERLLIEIRRIDNRILKRELKIFLPVSFWNILDNLKENLIRELERI